MNTRYMGDATDGIDDCIHGVDPQDNCEDCERREKRETARRWDVYSTGNHQAVVYDEGTGRDIAVAYDKADAPLIAAAPDLLAALKGLVERVGWNEEIPEVKIAAAVLRQAEGGA